MTLLVVALLAADPLALTPAQTKAFDHFYSLEYDQAAAEFEKLIAEAPTEPARYNHLAQALIYREMLKAGALESELVSGGNAFLKRDRIVPEPEVAQRFEAAIGKALELANQRVAQSPRDPVALYTRGAAYGLRSNWDFMVRKAYFDALRSLTASRKDCKKAFEIDPSFHDARLVEGFHDYVVGSLPAYVRMLGFLAGFRGDKEGGIRTLQEVAAKGRLASVDAKILLGVIYRRERRPEVSIPIVTDLIRRFPRNYLFALEEGQMWADIGDRQKAIAAIDRAGELLAKGYTGGGTLVPARIDFARGVTLFWYDDFPAAIENLERASKQSSTLDLHSNVLCWLRLGQTYDLWGDREQAKRAYRVAAKIAPRSEEAKQARRYESSRYQREVRPGARVKYQVR